WFTARVQLLDDGVAALKQRTTAPTAERPVGGLRGKRVLVADDEPVNLEIAQAMLTHAGLEVDTASDGQQVLAKAASQTYDLILMDMRMPLMDGLEATRRLRSSDRWASVPVIAMTASAFAQDEALCREAGMNDFICKPVRSEVLLETVWRWLSQR
ncbi:response regulator, partial [Ideonella sp.]|uniref:response regulator n=1 Tax=Ideonella sp. TaxID=1929293 RepID=UPI003BB6704D